MIFTSLKHPIRRKILRVLSSEAQTFSDLQKQFNIESSHLTYHLEGLGNLLYKTQDGKYALSSLGEAAVSMMKNVEEPQTTLHFPFSNARSIVSGKKIVGRTVAVALGIMCIVLSATLVGAFAYYVPLINDKNSTISLLNSQVMNLQNQTVYDNATMVNLQSQIGSLKSQISDLEKRAISDNATLANLQNQLNWLLNWSTSLQDMVLSNPSAWENKTVVVEGILSLIVHFPFESLPYAMVLSSGSQSIGVSYNGSWSDIVSPLNASLQGLVRVYGVVRKGYDVINGIQVVMGDNVFNETQVTVVYYIEAQRIEPL